MATGKFDNVDLGSDKTMQRMIKSEQDKRRKIINDCAEYLRERNFEDAANCLKHMT